MPKNVVKAGLDAPRAQRVKENLRRVFRFVRVEFVIKLTPRMIGIHQVDQFLTQPLDLFVVKYPNASQIAVLVEKPNLLLVQPVAVPTPPVDRRNKKIADPFMMFG